MIYAVTVTRIQQIVKTDLLTFGAMRANQILQDLVAVELGKLRGEAT